MKIKNKILGAMLMSGILITMANVSKAAIEVKPGTSSYVDITASDSYKLCYDLREYDTTLGTNSLDPHLTLNKDWGAVTYLSVSSYGAVRGYQGPSVTIGSTDYTSTTGNKSGVMNFGKTYTQTSSLFGGRSADYNTTTNLKNNLNTKYVENLATTNNVENTKGQALMEVNAWYNSLSSTGFYPRGDYPVGIRAGVFGIYSYNGGHDYYGSGSGNSKTTFRPVIWN